MKTVSKYTALSLIFGCALAHQSQDSEQALAAEFISNHIDRIAYAQAILGEEYELIENVAEQNFNIYNFVFQEVSLRMPRENLAMHHRVARAIVTESARHRIDPLFILAQIQHESKFRLKSVGRHGELGLMQIKPSTAREIARYKGAYLARSEDLFQPEINIRWGAEYLMSLRKKFRATPTAFLEAYNMGPNRWNTRSKNGNLTPTAYSLTTRKHMLDLYLKLGEQLKRPHFASLPVRSAQPNEAKLANIQL